MKRKTDSLRWAYLILGVLALLVAGVVYAWSILKAPLAEAFGWSGSELALNFTLTMCFFCLGGFAGGLLSRRLGDRLCPVSASVLPITSLSRLSVRGSRTRRGFAPGR